MDVSFFLHQQPKLLTTCDDWTLETVELTCKQKGFTLKPTMHTQLLSVHTCCASAVTKA